MIGLGDPACIARLNAGCRRSRLLTQEADDLLADGNVELARRTLEAALIAEPRTIEARELTQRIKHLESVDEDWPEINNRCRGF